MAWAAGAGLGLAIVKQAAEAHGGFAVAGNAPGGGAVVRVCFGPILDGSVPESDGLPAELRAADLAGSDSAAR
jgi:hypothetical protein